MKNSWKGGFHRYQRNSNNKSLPKQIIDIIDPYTLCVCISFNRAGTLLAIGCNDGRLILWDFITNSIARTFYGHSSTVSSLSWSQDDKYICTGSLDRTVVVWDIVKREQICRCTNFVSCINKVQFNPRDKNIILISSWFEAPILFDIEAMKYIQIFNDFSDHENKCTISTFSTNGLVSSFSKRGKYIFIGDPMGNISVFDSQNLKFLIAFTWNKREKSDSHPPINIEPVRKNMRLHKNSAILQISIKDFAFSRKSNRDNFVVLCFDRWIRLYYMDNIEKLIKENVINSIQQPLKYGDIFTNEITYLPPSFQYCASENYDSWITCKYSNDGNYIFSIGPKLNSIFIWSLKFMEPQCILTMDNALDSLTDIAWHPLYSIICSLTDGRCNVWGRQTEESWCNYEPNFNQLDHCIEYSEREGEFDISDEDRICDQPNDDIDGDNQEIDILTCNSTPPPYLSSDEDPRQENLCFLAYNSDPDDNSKSP